MSYPPYCALQVIRVKDTQRNTNDAKLYVKIKHGESILKMCEIDDDGKPSWHDTFTFPRLDPTTVLNISLKKKSLMRFRNELGRADITVAQLLEAPAEHEVRLSRMQYGRPEHAATVLLAYRGIDALSRATIDVKAAEESVERIRNSGEKSESAVAVIGSVKEVVDTIVEIVDKAVEIHPLFQVSWKATSALYKLVSHQYDNDRKLLGMVDRMRNAHDFTIAAKDLKDTGNVIKPKLKELLDETAKCSEFVREYVKHNFAARMARIRGGERIDEFSGRFSDLRKELDSRIGVMAARIVDEIGQQQTMYAQVISETRNVVIDMSLVQQLNPPKSDASDVSKRPRCLEGTREGYLGPIVDFLFSESTSNILWLTGAAGSGKSTIAVTASDRCDKRGRNAAYLFFERGKANPNSVIRTIAHKLAMLRPSIASHVAKVVSENKNIIGNTLKTQFEELLLGPLNASQSAETDRIVIILDALDECGSVEERQDLLRVLKNDFAQLPSNVRILVTSRPEGDIMEELTSARHIQHIPLKHDSEESRDDVGEYFRKEMFEAVKGKAPIGREWKDVYRLLTDAAEGLFIWASTAVKMVARSINPSGKLGGLLDDIQAVGRYGIDSLYATAIKESGIAWDELESRELFTLVVGLVVGAKGGMSADIIAAFLGVDAESVDRLLSRLRSVLFYERGQSVRLHHASFADYVTSAERSGSEYWHLDETGQRLVIAERCLDIMAEMLRFNICDIESSFVYNKEITDLRERLRGNVPAHLNYACRFWAVHVCELPHPMGSTSLVAKLRTFAHTRLLYWFEVLSLTGNFNRVAIRALYEVTLWAASIDPDLSSFVWAAYRLASVFSFPISQSAPQIYLSAISLWHGESRVADLYSRTHPCVRVRRYGSKPPAQCIKAIAGHKGQVASVAFSPSGERVVSGSLDRTVCIWDADTGELVLGPLKGHTDWVSSVAFSRDGKRVVSCSDDKTLRVWSSVTGELVAGPFKGHEGVVNSVVFSPDGTRLVSGSYDYTVRIWDLDTGKLISGPFEGHTGWVFSVAFSPDGARVVSGSNDETIRVWSADTGVVVAGPFKGHAGGVTSVGFSPDGSRIVSGSLDMTVRVWNAETGELISGPFEGHTDIVNSVAFSPDGNLVISGSSDKTVRIWDSNTGELVSGPFEGHANAATSVAFSPGRKRAVSGSGDGTLRIWDVDSGVVLSSRLNRHKSAVCSVGFSADGKRAVSGFEDGRIRVWDSDSGELVSDAFEGHKDRVCSVALSADGTLVVSGSGDKTVRVWNASSGELVSVPLEGHTGLVCSFAFSRDGNRIASGSRDSTVRIWSAASGELVSSPLKGHTDWVGSVAFSPDGDLVVSGSSDRTVRVRNAVSGALVSGPFQERKSHLVSVIFSLNGDRIVSGSGFGTIHIRNAVTGELVLGPLNGHTDWVYSVAFSSDGKRLVSGSRDNTVRIWDAVSGELISTFYGHGRGVLSVVFSPDGRYIYSGSLDGTIRSWYVDDGEVMRERISKHPNNSLSIVPERTLEAYRVAEVTGSDLPERRTITDWKMTEDGWVIGENGDPLTWVPEDMRMTLWGARNKSVFGCQFSTGPDFSGAPVGEGWYKGFPRLVEEKRSDRADSATG